MMTLDEAVKLMRLTDVERWVIVPVTRRQSVAEHSYRVWVLALSLYDAMVVVPHNSFERDSVSYWALTHDADEIWTGDLPSTIKEVLEELHPGILKRLSDHVLSKHLPRLADTMRGLENTFAAAVVKIADCIEALAYYTHYGYNSRDKVVIDTFLRDRLKKALEGADRKYPNAGVRNVSVEWAAEALEKI
jgi:5'-deoxynucleotidase YfbR-like HD superfamily hydrolase